MTKTKKKTASALPAEVTEAARRGGFSGAQYNHVAVTASLDHIRLVRNAFEANAAMLADEPDAELSYGRAVVSCRYDEESHVAAAIFQFNLSATCGEEVLLRCTADYAVVYTMAEDAHAEAATSFCKHVGSFAAYPYFRALAAQMCWNADIPLPPLPAIAALPVVGGRDPEAENTKDHR